MPSASEPLENAKHEQFAQDVASGIPPEQAFSKISPNASDNPFVLMLNRIIFLKEQKVESVKWSRAESMEKLREIVEDPDVKPFDRVNAIKILNEMHGYTQPKNDRASIENRGVMFLAPDGIKLDPKFLENAKKELQENLVHDNMKPVTIETEVVNVTPNKNT